MERYKNDILNICTKGRQIINRYVKIFPKEIEWYKGKSCSILGCLGIFNNLFYLTRGIENCFQNSSPIKRLALKDILRRALSQLILSVAHYEEQATYGNRPCFS